MLSVPIPWILITLFKKRVVLATQTDRNKKITLQLWICRERLAWVFVSCIHLWCVIFLANFVRYYPYTIIEKWAIATVWSVFHRLVSAPVIRATWMLLILFLSQIGPCLDFFIVMSSTTAVFPPLAQIKQSDKAMVYEADAYDRWRKVNVLRKAGLLSVHASSVRGKKSHEEGGDDSHNDGADDDDGGMDMGGFD